MGTLIRDVGYSLRQMRKAPGLTLVAIITLALGIGANASIFTLVHAVLLQPLPVENPSQLYRLGSNDINCCVLGGLLGRLGRFLVSAVSESERADAGARKSYGNPRRRVER